VTTGGIGVFAVIAALGFFMWYRRRARPALTAPPAAAAAPPARNPEDTLQI
jgi:hypothetical protein